MSLLRMASRGGHAEIVRLLLDHEADVDIIRTRDFTTSPGVAAQNGNTDAVELLLMAGTDTDAADTCGFTTLFVACRAGQVDTANRCLSTKST